MYLCIVMCKMWMTSMVCGWKKIWICTAWMISKAWMISRLLIAFICMVVFELSINKHTYAVKLQGRCLESGRWVGFSWRSTRRKVYNVTNFCMHLLMEWLIHMLRTYDIGCRGYRSYVPAMGCGWSVWFWRGARKAMEASNTKISRVLWCSLC